MKDGVEYSWHLHLGVSAMQLMQYVLNCYKAIIFLSKNDVTAFPISSVSVCKDDPECAAVHTAWASGSYS